MTPSPPGRPQWADPWQHYDLGHGLCSCTFFEQCQHRMACAKCDFNVPENSTRAQLLETKANLQQMLIAIPLTDDERAAVDDGQEALDKLPERLADTPAPDGSTPRELACGSADPAAIADPSGSSDLTTASTRHLRKASTGTVPREPVRRQVISAALELNGPSTGACQ